MSDMNIKNIPDMSMIMTEYIYVIKSTIYLYSIYCELVFTVILYILSRYITQSNLNLLKYILKILMIIYLFSSKGKLITQESS